MAAIRAAEAEVDSAESDWLDCKEETKAAKSIMDAAIARLRSVIRGSDQPELPFEAGDEELAEIALVAEDAEADERDPYLLPGVVDESEPAAAVPYDEAADMPLMMLETSQLRKYAGPDLLGMTEKSIEAVWKLCGGKTVGAFEAWQREVAESIGPESVTWLELFADAKGLSAKWAGRMESTLDLFRQFNPVPSADDAPTLFDVAENESREMPD